MLPAKEVSFASLHGSARFPYFMVDQIRKFPTQIVNTVENLSEP
jgi:hypothetical protein